MEAKRIKNGLCIDVEGYADISDKLPAKAELSRKNLAGVFKNTVRILDILEEANTKGTFFMLASYVEQMPELAAEIERRGHEIGLHGYNHQRLGSMSRDDFDRALEKGLGILKKYTSAEIIGYQAPDFSLSRDTYWALEVLVKRGFKYDCSIFPVRHPDYGLEGFRRFPVCIKEEFYEIPMPALRVLGKNIPFGGGGYLRHFPYWLNRLSFQAYNRSGHSGLTYAHPWEFENPRDWSGLFELKKISRLDRWRYFGGCGEEFSSKFKRLIRDFLFVPVREIYKELL